MNNGVKLIFTFVAGAAVGSVVTWKLVKTKYEQIAQEEIDSVLEVYSKNANKVDSVDEETPSIRDEYNVIVNNYTSNSEEKGGSDDMKYNEPYSITPDAFAWDDEYESVSLTYYADGILADDTNDEVIEDVEGTVGLDFPNLFGEYEEDTVYIRNDKLKTNYEINKDNRGYTTVTGYNLDLTDDEE